MRKRISVYFYHRGDCNDILDLYEKKTTGVIQNKGTVCAEDAYKAMNEADVLISISNVAGDQISGKTFDYISTGKPLIHFYYNENDRNAKLLKQYKRALCIQIGKDVQSSSREIEEYIEASAITPLSFDDVIRTFFYYTAESVVRVLFEG